MKQRKAFERRTAAQRASRREAAVALSRTQGGLVARRQLYALGITRGEVRANVTARRWFPRGNHVLLVDPESLDDLADLWVAVLSGGPRAQLDGASSLIAAGLKGYHVRRHRVSVPRGERVFREAGVDVRQTRRWDEADCVSVGIPRTRQPVAAVRGALWADSDKQAALLLSMAVQQGIVSAAQLGEQLVRIKKAPRRAFLCDVVLDLAGGVESLGELDFARECRRRGLPEPSRQVVRETKGGRYFLDVSWERWHVVVEIDGIHHAWVSQLVPDALRQNEITLSADTVLRLPLLGLRIAPDDFFTQIERALESAGWRRSSAA